MKKKDDNKVNRVVVEILNDTYTLIGDSSPEYIKMVATFVDQELFSIRKKHPRLSRNRLLVLALMNIAERFFCEREKGDRLHDEYRKLKREMKNLEKHMEDGNRKVKGGEG